MSDLVFLRQEVKIEPLMSGWYAWSHLVAPVQYAMNALYRHIPLLQSFVKNPTVHVAAASDPQLFAGPFVDLSERRTLDAKSLVDSTELNASRLLRIAHDLKQLDRRLQETASGYSLGELYSTLPDSLRGLVEFVYDTNSHARVRLYEELVYDEFGTSAMESIALNSLRDEDRTFFMSTPRLESDDVMCIPMAFSDSRVDLISSMRAKARSLEDLMNKFEITDSAQRQRFAGYFTASPPVRRGSQYLGHGVRVRYFGHACVLLETNELSILLDPMSAWGPNEDGRYTFVDLPDKIDYVVLSHNHQDHCCPEMLIQLRHRVGKVLVPRNNCGSISDPSMKLMLARLGFTDVCTMDPFDEISFADGKIVSLPFPGEHGELDIYTRQSILIELKGRRFAFLVDSDGWDPILFQRIARRTGKRVDMLFLGMECDGAPFTWLYGPLLTKAVTRKNDESRTFSGLNCDRAIKVVQQFDAAKVFVYAMGQEPWLRHIMGLEYTADSIQLREVSAFIENCKKQNISAEKLYISEEIELLAT